MQRLFSATVVATLVVAASVLQAAIKPVTKIVAQPGAPVEISAYTANYEPRSSQYVTRGIHHDLKYTNKSTKEIAAIQVGLVSFDVWNEYLTRTNGLDSDTLPPGKSSGGSWVASTYADFSFLTGVAYVNRVRFVDGEIWTADQRQILDELKKIQQDFDATNLTKPETKP
jgi:hypothetical protein